MEEIKERLQADVLRKKIKKELKYKEPKIPKNRCGNCKHSYCHNPGAYIPGYSCKLIEKRLKKFYPYGHMLVDLLGCCTEYSN